METKLKANKSKAKRIKILLKQYKGVIKKHQELANFEEPVLFLIRNNRRVEFYDKVTQGRFKFKHTDEKEREIELSPQFLHTFDYGKRDFKGYIVYEDSPTPLPESPIVTGEMFTMAIDKTLNDMKKWKAEETRAIGDLIWNIAKGIGAVIGIIAVAKLLVPSLHIPFLDSAVPVVKSAVQNATQNITNITELTANMTKLP